MKDPPRALDEERNPCVEEHKMSLNCLDVNDYKREKCQNYFENYKACNAFWNEVRKHRRYNGIKPELPPLSERKSIKETYLKTGKIN